jgi:hypothetical protein
MEAPVRAELDTLLKMMEAWKIDYERFITPEGGDEFLVEDFICEVQDHVYPYIRRMIECEYITTAEATEFFEKCAEHVNELAKLCAEGKVVANDYSI